MKNAVRHCKVLISVNMVRKYEEGNYEKSTTTFIGIDDGITNGRM